MKSKSRLEKRVEAIEFRLGMDASICTCWTDRGGGNISGINDPNCPFHHPKLGMAGTICDPHRCFVCGESADMGFGNAFGPTRGYCKDHIPKTEPESRCPRCNHILHDGVCVFCPYPRKSNLPLRARVARALEYTAWTDRNGEWRSNLGQFIPKGVEYPHIPDYDKHVELAMGALEEYDNRQEYDLRVQMTKYGSGWNVWIGAFWVAELTGKSEQPLAENPSLPVAICEAICSHAEQSK